MDAEQMENGALGLRMLAEKEHGCSIGLNGLCIHGGASRATCQRCKNQDKAGGRKA